MSVGKIWMLDGLVSTHCKLLDSGRKGLLVTNASAYMSGTSVPEVKSFITLTPAHPTMALMLARVTAEVSYLNLSIEVFLLAFVETIVEMSRSPSRWDFIVSAVPVVDEI